MHLNLHLLFHMKYVHGTHKMHNLLTHQTAMPTLFCSVTLHVLHWFLVTKYHLLLVNFNGMMMKGWWEDWFYDLPNVESPFLFFLWIFSSNGIKRNYRRCSLQMGTITLYIGNYHQSKFDNYNLAPHQIIISLMVSTQLAFHNIYALSHTFILIRPL